MSSPREKLRKFPRVKQVCHMKGNHGSPKCGSREKTTTVVGSHWKVIRAIAENLPKDLHLYRNLVGIAVYIYIYIYDFRASFSWQLTLEISFSINMQLFCITK